MRRLLPLLTLLAGCAIIPAYERPAAPVPAQWPMKVGVGGTVSVGDWLAYFTDPQLQKLIAAALEHNRDLAVAVARVAEARALAGLARSDRLPALDVNLQQQAAQTPADLSTTRRETIGRRYDANLGVAAFELDFWGRVGSLETAARANFFASEFARRAFRLSLIADVATTYYSLAELDARLALAEAAESSRAASLRLIGQRRDVGLASDLDFFSADGAYQNARAEAASLARQRAVAENALRLLIGKEIEAVLPAPASPKGAGRQNAAIPRVGKELTVASAFAALPEVAVGLPSEVLLNRPDVLAAEQRLVAANANIGAARAAFLPKIVLTATAGTASRALSSLFGGGSGVWSFVPLIKWPLFDAGRSEANVDLAEARKNIAVAEYEKTIQQAFREVADLLAARSYYAMQLQAQEAAERALAERFKRVEQRYLGGVSGYLELLDAQREQFTAQQTTLATRRALAATGASLFKALGG